MELLSYISITDSLKCDAAFDAQSWTSLGSLHLFKQLAVESRDLSQAEKKVTVVKPEQIFKMTIIFSQKGQKWSLVILSENSCHF